jgi:hypothetical protein
MFTSDDAIHALWNAGHKAWAYTPRGGSRPCVAFYVDTLQEAWIAASMGCDTLAPLGVPSFDGHGTGWAVHWPAFPWPHGVPDHTEPDHEEWIQRTRIR